MTRQQAEQFIAVYNALLTISTKGEDTRTMGRILTIMEELANSIQVIEDKTPNVAPVVEPETEGE